MAAFITTDLTCSCDMYEYLAFQRFIRQRVTEFRYLSVFSGQKFSITNTNYIV
jgi:hypothetical protein